MPKTWFCTILSSALILGSSGFAQDETIAVEEKAKPDPAKISEALGHLIGKNLLDMGIKIDIAQVVKGLKDSSSGKEAPLSEQECVAAISSAQESAFKDKAQKNLQEADAFMQKNKALSGVLSFEEGKLQYKVVNEGSGEAVQPHASPLVKYTGKFLDGKIFGSSKEDEKVSLDELIPGLKIGLVGMKEGEKRSFYIHPDLGYGTAGMLPPNSLLIFEVEIIKAQETSASDEPKLTTQSTEEGDALKDALSSDDANATLR